MSHPLAITTPPTLPATGARAVTVQFALLLAAAFVLPALAHAAGAPVRLLLPMHWPVLLAGLCYGWRSGLAVGMAAPLASAALSGMPGPLLLPVMTLELAAYGALAGLGVQALRLSRPIALLLAGLGGRVVFVLVALVTGVAAGPSGAWLQAALVPGLAALLAQVVLLPVLAAWWVRREDRGRRPA